MIDDYSEINDIEAGCDCVPWDMIDPAKALDEELPLSECVDDEVTYARYRLVKKCDEFRLNNSRILDFCGELYERLSSEEV